VNQAVSLTYPFPTNMQTTHTDRLDWTDYFAVFLMI
jgi:hypothetical protein